MSRRRIPYWSFLIAVAALVVAPSLAQAHFLWLTAEREDEKPVVQAFLSEQPVPDLPEFLRAIENARFSANDQAIERSKVENTFVLKLPESLPKAIDGVCDLGVMSRGGETFRLLYTARVQFGALDAKARENAENLRVRLVANKSAEPRVLVSIHGKPAADALVKAYLEDGTIQEIKTDVEGRLDVPGVAEGRTVLLVKWTDGIPGESDGKAFEETRYYATLTVAPEASESVAAAETKNDANAPYAVLPEALNSFGGAVVGDWLYVYSGHTGERHHYDVNTTTKHFRRLNLNDRTTWEELPCGPALQGVALVAHGENLYRIGGMSAHNAEGKRADLKSVADFARFDTESKTWTDLPPLPEPRSTHDAVVAGDAIYVVGGWTMPGGDATMAYWSDTALKFDLSQPDAQWEELPEQPFARRALAAAALDGKIYAIGGLTEDGKVETTVEIFDTAKGTWSRGPDLPGASRVQGFAASAFGVNGRLYANGIDGFVYRLSEDGQNWEAVDRLAIPRLTHRLLPGNQNNLLAVGGNFAGDPVKIIESVSLDHLSLAPKSVAWSVPNEGHARQGQSVGLYRSNLLAVGGNRSPKPHAFDPENFVNEALGFSIASLTVETLPALPAPRQSAEFVVAPEGRGGVPYLLGGIGQDGEVTRTLGEISRFDPETEEWSLLDATIPDARGMFGAAVHGDTVWIFGGNIWDPRDADSPASRPLDVLRWEVGSEGSTFEKSGHQLPRGRRSFAGAVLDGKYYLVGGLGGDGRLVGETDVFDFASGEWSQIPSPSAPRLFADLVALNGKLYLGGGFAPSEESGFSPSRTIEVFDPSSGDWSILDAEVPLSTSRVRMFAQGGRLLFHGLDPEHGEARFALMAP